MNTYVELHRLMSLPVSLPVRGADGLAKRAFYGGVERQRLSSQSIKAHLRNAEGLVVTGPDGELIADDIGAIACRLGLDISVRSALIGERLIKPALVERGLPEDEAAIWAEALMDLFRSGKEKEPRPVKAKKERKSEDGETGEEARAEVQAEEEAGRQIIVLGRPEIAALVTLADAARKAGVKPAELRGIVGKAKLPKGAAEGLVSARDGLEAMRHHAGLDGALFGRMATGVAVSRIDSAVHVAHALTVHPIQSAVDFFSAQDSLQDTDAGETGGAHINSRELTTGVYYLYAVIDLNQITKNIAALIPSQRQDLVGWLVRAFATVTPAAMLGSTAPFADPGEVMVTVTNRQPISMMGAFERPCAPILSEAARILAAHVEHIWSLAGRPRHVFRLTDLTDKAQSCPAVERLAKSVAEVIA